LATLGFLAAAGLTSLATFFGFRTSGDTRKDPAAPEAP
jgi:hypothetical protein